MKPSLVLVALVATLSVTTAFADNSDSAKKTMDPHSPEAMKIWQEFATPGEQHKAMTALAGKWTYTTTMLEKPDGKPEVSKGTATFKSILGGRYVMQEIKGTAMGMPFEGMGIMGYDNLKKQTISTWVDNMGTGMVRGAGSYDAAAKLVKEDGEFTCPMTESHTMNYRSEWKMIDKNNQVFSMFMKGPDGKEFKSMEMVYKRAK